MRLTICLESDTESQVLSSVDMEEILKQCKENSISKEAFEKMKSKAHNHGYRQGYSKAIDDVLKLPKYTHYDTSNEFMNIRIDSISIEDILKLKEQKTMTNENNPNLTEMIREIHDGVAREMYCKGVDDFVKMCDEVKICETYDCVLFYDIEHIAERLKAGAKNERY